MVATPNQLFSICPDLRLSRTLWMNDDGDDDGNSNDLMPREQHV